MSRRRVTAAALALGLAAVALLAGCGTSPGEAKDRRVRLTVLAAASLTEPFDELAKRFEAQHTDVDVATGYDSSATIAAQVTSGAPADVVATADTTTMDVMRRGGALADPPVLFARNRLALVVPSGNPAGIHRLEDLASADYVVCVESAPCGSLARDLLAHSGITRPPRSFEVDVKAVLTKVRMGEADAGLVYASDVVAAGGSVEEIPIDATETTGYPIAVTAVSSHPDLARDWLETVRSPEGQRVLARAGFTTAAGTGSSP